MTNQHTQAPWWMAATGESGKIGFDIGAGDCVIGYMQERSDALLAKAAPDLLAALSELLDWARENTSPSDANSPHNILISATAAIAEAKGMTLSPEINVCDTFKP